MQAHLTLLFQAGDPERLIRYVDGLDQDKFSLVTFVDTLVPALVMESNLRFGSFHLIKMSLFLRNLSLRGVFSSETEKALAKLVLQHLFHLEWIRVSADPLSHTPDTVTHPLDEMLSEISDGNAHNAYFYASQAYFKEKDQLFNTLLLNGSIAIPDTLGHSISCFFPVLEDVIAVDHPAAGTSLLSLIMYLCRFRRSGLPAATQRSPIGDAQKSQLLRKAASGNGIVAIHHMITFYIYQAWESATWNQDTIPPWPLITDWIDDKTIDSSRQARAAEPKPTALPESYQQWQQIFSSGNREAIIDSVIAIRDKSWHQACDWLFSVYAEYYTPDWDPHYFTSLYAALELSRDPTIADQDSTMALIQALQYFLEGIQS